jgi:hypothetical protein
LIKVPRTDPKESGEAPWPHPLFVRAFELTWLVPLVQASSASFTASSTFLLRSTAGWPLARTTTARRGRDAAGRTCGRLRRVGFASIIFATVMQPHQGDAFHFNEPSRWIRVRWGLSGFGTGDVQKRGHHPPFLETFALGDSFWLRSIIQ